MALSIKDAKKGDYVQYIGYRDLQDTGNFTVGKYYQLRSDYKDKCYPKSPWAHIDSGYLAFELDDKGSTTNGWGAGLFKLVATKPGRQAEQDFLASLDCTEKTQPTIRRNLAFYKRSGLPWTDTELDKIREYCGSPSLTDILGFTTYKFIFDDATSTRFMYPWAGQENNPNFKNCRQIAYEDIFCNKRTAIVTKEHSGFPIGSRIIQTNTQDPTTAWALWKLADDISDSPTTYYCAIGTYCQWETDVSINPCSEIPTIPAPQIKPTQKEITMPTTIQQILSRLFGLEKPTTDYENRAAYIVVAYNRDGSEMGTATAASLKIIKDKVAATPELWGCKVLAYKLEKEVSVTVPVKATDITVHVPVAEEPAEK